MRGSPQRSRSVGYCAINENIRHEDDDGIGQERVFMGPGKDVCYEKKGEAY